MRLCIHQELLSKNSSNERMIPEHIMDIKLTWTHIMGSDTPIKVKTANCGRYTRTTKLVLNIVTWDSFNVGIDLNNA